MANASLTYTSTAKHHIILCALCYSVAFRWLLHAEEYVPHADLASVRQHVVSVSARILGAVSKIRLSDVTTQFVERLDERVNPKKDIGARAADLTLQRSQLLKLCSGPRFRCC